MPYYFMRDTPLQALEQLMMSQPGQKPRGGGIYRSPFRYTPEDVACEYCQNYVRKHPCRLCEWIYCDPPYFEAECYEVAFPKENHQRLHDTLLNCHGYVMVSYNYCPYICELYQEFYIFRVVRPNSMSQTAGSEYEEVIITNYDPRKACWQLSLESLLNCGSEARYELIHEPERPIKTTN